MLRKLLKAPLRAALRNRWIRAKIVHELEQDYFGDLRIEAPLSGGMRCPITRGGNIHSFAEIFVEGEYAPLLKQMELPRRWLDLGCHAGFFSAWLAWHWRKAGSNDFSALLVDADPRVAADVQALIAANGLGGQFSFAPGLIGQGSGERGFGLREAMASSADLGAPAEVRNVPVLGAKRILELFPGPYDLVKVDIEGAEAEFAGNYPEVLGQARRLVLEWHSAKPEEKTREALGEQLARHGLEFQAALQAPRTRSCGGKAQVAGCDLYRRAGER